MKELRGTTAIVTGASRGIGVYIARALAEEGANLSLAARSADELEQVRAGLEALGAGANCATAAVGGSAGATTSRPRPCGSRSNRPARSS